MTDTLQEQRSSATKVIRSRDKKLAGRWRGCHHAKAHIIVGGGILPVSPLLAPFKKMAEVIFLRRSPDWPLHHLRIEP